jgi:hypothetical protein
MTTPIPDRLTAALDKALNDVGVTLDMRKVKAVAAALADRHEPGERLRAAVHDYLWSDPDGRDDALADLMKAYDEAVAARPEPGELNAKIVARLVRAYRVHPVEVATACDEQIDRSGNLLGWLREVTQAR